MSKVKKTYVSLKPKDVKKVVSRKFEINTANKLLSFPNSQWELDDSKYSWNGKEITTVKEKS